jgi:hypothetical protein
MREMCKIPGCPDLACMRVSLRGGQRPEVVPVKPLYRKPPTVRIEEIPPVS